MERTRPTILDEIVARNRSELARRIERTPLAELEERAARAEPPRDFAAALRAPLALSSPADSTSPPSRGRGSPLTPPSPAGKGGRGLGPRLIAEIKRASPSKGPLFPDLDPARLAAGYESGGAAAISVLTEPFYFMGSLDDLAAAKAATRLPILRKDFLFDPYQVVEARAAGADAVLLIVAVLDGALLGEMLALAGALGMAALVETHDAAEVERALEAGAQVVGINNRDLRTFRVDLETTGRLRPLIPPERVVVSESGIHGPADVARLREWGVDAMLVGESLVKSDDFAAKARELLR